MALVKTTAVDWAFEADLSTNLPTSARIFYAFWLRRDDTTTGFSPCDLTTVQGATDERIFATSRAGASTAFMSYHSDTASNYNSGTRGNGNDTDWHHFATALGPLDGSSSVALRFWWDGTVATGGTGTVANDSAKHWRYPRLARTWTGGNMKGKLAHFCVATGLTTGEEDTLVSALQTATPDTLGNVLLAWDLIGDGVASKGAINFSEVDGTATFDSDDPLPASPGGSSTGNRLIMW